MRCGRILDRSKRRAKLMRTDADAHSNKNDNTVAKSPQYNIVGIVRLLRDQVYLQRTVDRRAHDIQLVQLPDNRWQNVIVTQTVRHVHLSVHARCWLMVGFDDNSCWAAVKNDWQLTGVAWLMTTGGYGSCGMTYIALVLSIDIYWGCWETKNDTGQLDLIAKLSEAWFRDAG